jgi:hypothetical protein
MQHLATLMSTLAPQNRRIRDAFVYLGLEHGCVGWNQIKTAAGADSIVLQNYVSENGKNPGFSSVAYS